MPAGPELDALVATKIMGWIDRGPHWVGPDGFGYDAPPLYSTDIAAAFEVVDRMHALGYFWWMASSIGRPGVVQAHVRRRIDCETIGNGYACDTTAHSICVAALEALGHAQ